MVATSMSPANWQLSRIPCDAYSSTRAAKVTGLMPERGPASCQQLVFSHLE